MHELLADLDEIQEIERRRAKNDHATAVWMARRKEVSDRFQAAVAARNVKVRQALETGEVPPPPLDESQYQVEGTLKFFYDRRDELDAEEARAIAALAPTIQARVDRRLSRIRAQMTPHLQALSDLTEQLNDLRRLLDRVDRAGAAGGHRPPRHDLTLGEASDWAARDVDLTQPTPDSSAVFVGGDLERD